MIKFRKTHTVLFALIDFASAIAAWFSFFMYRKYFIEPDKFGYSIPFEIGQSFYLGILYVPIYWLLLYFLSGYYNDVWRKSRLKELYNTFTITLFGVVVLFFVLLLDDEVSSYKDYYSTFITLFLLHYGITIFSRIILISYIKSLIRSKKIGFKAIIIGNNKRAYDLYHDITHEKFPSGFIIDGFVSEDGIRNEMPEAIKCLGKYADLPQLINKHLIEEVIIAIDSSKHHDIIQVTNILEGEKIILKIIPDTYDVLSGNVKFENVVGTALIEVKHEIMPQWQWFLKRIIDISASVVVLVLLSPIYLTVAISVKLSSPGPIFFKQIRVGRFGKPFHIFKFRSMYTDAESSGPALSSKNDKRITPSGKFLRKYRLDEIPQFYNVLIGDMSLVGPRPERKFYIDQIVQFAPYYKQLLRVRPGITSWGMVKYGYAENIDQMLERLKFDILYIENMSLMVDFRIMIYTVKTIIQGRGK